MSEYSNESDKSTWPDEPETSELDNLVSNKKIAESKESASENIIGSKNAGTNLKKKSPSLKSTESNVIATSKKAAPKPKAEVSKLKEDTVAIYSEKNVVWEGVGKVSKGYNIVTKEASDKWLTRNHARIATPEEVAREFGK